MTTETADASRSVRPKSRIGRPFKPGNAGKPKGTRDRYTLVGIEVCRAMAGRAADRLAALIDSRSHRVSLEASRLVLAYAWGAPRQTLELSGGFGDLARELSAALAEARARRETFETRTQIVPALEAGIAGAALEGGKQGIEEPLLGSGGASAEPPETAPQGPTEAPRNAAMPEAALVGDRVTGEDVGTAPGKVDE